MSDSEQEIDISKSIGIDIDDSSESEDSSFEKNDYYQDEIIDSSDDESDDDLGSHHKFHQTEKEKDLGGFPSLEMSDEEENFDDEIQPKENKSLDDDDDDDAFFAKLGAAGGSKKKSIYSFRGMGLSKTICANVARKGYKMATPIQRKTIPVVMEGRDVVGMARTGSGKTAAFVLPMIEKLKVHSARVGARAVILSPSRELAEQTMRVVKDFSRGTDLRVALIVGGYSLEDQFSRIMSNPDIIIATPGRFLHLKVEMQLDLRSIEYIVFDEADRLFELGFAEQLNEIIASLSSSRQTLLFSATLPTSLVEFAKAGLQDPVLVRLDAETKISEELEMAYFTIKDGEREAALAYILQSVIKMPLATEQQLKYLAEEDDDDGDDNYTGKFSKGKNKRFEHRTKLPPANELPSPHSTIVFTPTKHHVEYIAGILRDLGYAVSYIYGTLDQAARKQQLYRFRAGKTTILVVTDVAARGIDIPVLANVINYSLPSSPKVFVHRVGRTARAGRRGWAYSLIRESDIAYLLDLELFLGRKILLPFQVQLGERINYTERLVIGSLPREGLEQSMEEVESVIKRNYDIQNMRDVANRGEKLYLKTRGNASQESSKRSKDIISSEKWDGRHPLFGNESSEAKRDQFLQRLANRRVKDTVFEFKKTQYGSTAELMARRRKQLAPIQARSLEKKNIISKEKEAGLVHSMDAELFKDEDIDDEKSKKPSDNQKLATEKDILNIFTEVEDTRSKKKKQKDFKDPNFYLSHYAPSSVAEERAYSISGNNGKFFGEAARAATFNLVDEGNDFIQKQGMKWDKKRGKYINAGSTSADGQSIKYIRGENGTKIPASYRSGRFDSWKKAHKTGNLRVGSFESSTGPNQYVAPGSNVATGANGKPIYKHNKVQAPKLADKARDDYHKQRKRVKAALEKGIRVKGKQPIFNGDSELQSVDQMRKARALKEQRREKNGRPSKKKKV